MYDLALFGGSECWGFERMVVLWLSSLALLKSLTGRLGEREEELTGNRGEGFGLSLWVSSSNSGSYGMSTPFMRLAFDFRRVVRLRGGPGGIMK